MSDFRAPIQALAEYYKTLGKGRSKARSLSEYHEIMARRQAVIHCALLVLTPDDWHEFRREIKEAE